VELCFFVANQTANGDYAVFEVACNIGIDDAVCRKAYFTADKFIKTICACVIINVTFERNLGTA
jgi:hypothetical protein